MIAFNVGQTYQLKVTATLKSGNTQIVTGQCSYASDSIDIIVNNSGVLSATSAGTANITVIINGIKSIVPIMANE